MVVSEVGLDDLAAQAGAGFLGVPHDERGGDEDGGVGAEQTPIAIGRANSSMAGLP
jgi:hypothetical protein